MVKNLKLPAIIIACGLILAILACLAVGATKVPTITEHSFNYSVTYKLDGETRILEGVYKCVFDGYSEGENPRDRYYTGEYTVDGQTTYSHSHKIAAKDGYELHIVTVFNECYLMGDEEDADYESYPDDPCLEATDNEGMQYGEDEMPGVFDVEIVSWDYPEPIENTFVVNGFSALHVGSMFCMLLIGLLVIVACLIFVKKDSDISYTAMDKVSILFNFLIALFAIPFIVVTVALFQLTLDTVSFVYQLFLCTPGITAFSIAASIALRRKGFTKTGFFLQFVGPALYLLPVVLELVITNVFG